MRDDFSHLIHEPLVSQTVCTALQVALVELLSSWGISPVAAVGHSSGEIAAAYAARRLTASETIVLAYFRGYTVSKNQRKGAMLAVGLSATEVEQHLIGLEAEIRIAARNSPKSVTLSGETAAIEDLASKLSKEGIFNRILKTGGNAYHSHHMQALGSLYEENARAGLEEIANFDDSTTGSQSAFWISSVTPEKATTEIEVSPSYWRQNLESPVLFDSGVTQLLKRSAKDIDILVEIGPHPALAGAIKQIMQEAKSNGSKIPLYMGSLNRSKADLESMLELGGNLFVQNTSVDIDAVNGFQDLSLDAQSPQMCLDLPNYQYNYGPVLFHENRLNKEWRLRKHLRHDLLGSRQLGGTSISPSWRNMFRLRDVPWLGDHRFIPQAIFPAAGFIAMAVEAAFQCHTEVSNAPPIAGYTFRNVKIHSTLEVPNVEVGTDVVTNVQKITPASGASTSSNWYEFRISSLSAETDSWVEHCTGTFKIEVSDNQHREIFADDEKNWQPVDMKEWYTKFAVLGLEYGPCFQALSGLKSATGRAAANIELAPTKSARLETESAYTLHPSSLDNCLQLANIAAYNGKFNAAKQAYIPVMFDDLTIWNRPDTDLSSPGYAVAEGEKRGSRGMYSRVQLFNSSGEVLVDMNHFRGISYDGVPFTSEDKLERPKDPFCRLVWKPDIADLSNEKARKLFPIINDDSPLLAEKLDKLAAYLVVSVFEQFRETSFSRDQDHLKHFMEWISQGHTRAAAGEMLFGLEATAATPSARSAVIENIFQDLDHMVETKLTRRMYENMSAIFSGRITGIELALKDNLLVDLYASGHGISSAYPSMQGLIDLLAHKDPRMKILEIGAGTGGATRQILNTLEAESSFKQFQEYTFSDLTPSFFSAAQKNFAACQGIQYSSLDIEVDPLQQGFSAAQFDLVIASQVLHATASLASTLQNVRKLLRPGGKLLLVECTRTHPVSTFALGTFPYYWNGLFDGRTNGPLAGRDRWQMKLVQNGFSRMDIILGDHDTNSGSASIILTTAIEPSVVVPKALQLESTTPGAFIITL